MRQQIKLQFNASFSGLTLKIAHVYQQADKLIVISTLISPRTMAFPGDSILMANATVDVPNATTPLTVSHYVLGFKAGFVDDTSEIENVFTPIDKMEDIQVLLKDAISLPLLSDKNIGLFATPPAPQKILYTFTGENNSRHYKIAVFSDSQVEAEKLRDQAIALFKQSNNAVESHCFDLEFNAAKQANLVANRVFGMLNKTTVPKTESQIREDVEKKMAAASNQYKIEIDILNLHTPLSYEARRFVGEEIYKEYHGRRFGDDSLTLTIFNKDKDKQEVLDKIYSKTFLAECLLQEQCGMKNN